MSSFEIDKRRIPARSASVPMGPQFIDNRSVKISHYLPDISKLLTPAEMLVLQEEAPEYHEFTDAVDQISNAQSTFSQSMVEFSNCIHSGGEELSQWVPTYTSSRTGPGASTFFQTSKIKADIDVERAFCEATIDDVINEIPKLLDSQ